MTVTERLRRMLDERGVVHIDLLDKTTYKPSENATCTATRRLGDTLEVSVRIYGATPEQAIEATLGRDQPIVRCCDCRYFDTRKCKSQWPFRLDGFCAWGERRADA